jgi:hypothetical protein
MGSVAGVFGHAQLVECQAHVARQFPHWQHCSRLLMASGGLAQTFRSRSAPMLLSTHSIHFQQRPVA